MAKVRKAKYIYKDGVYYEVGGDGDGDVVDQVARDAAAAAQATADAKPNIDDETASGTTVYSAEKVDELLPKPATANPKADGTAAVGSSAKYAREDHVHPVQDSGWQYTNFSSPFANYDSSTSNRPKYRKINGIVEVWGVATVSANTSTSNDLQVMFTLPSGYRPSWMLSIVSQGSGKNTWLFTIRPNGNACLSRYGTTSNGTISPGNWLPFHAVFIAA